MYKAVLFVEQKMIPTQKDYANLDLAKLCILKATKDDAHKSLTENADTFRGVFDTLRNEYDSIRDRIARNVVVSNEAFFETWHDVQFPKGADINVNMMPIDLNKFSTIPPFLDGYKDAIRTCERMQQGGWDTETWRTGKIGYVTIHESWVQPGETQRRPGLHVESPVVKVEGRIVRKDPDDLLWRRIAWGGGGWARDHPIDGIYIASNVEAMTQLFPSIIQRPEEFADVHGGVDSLREYLGQGVRTKANRLYWLTDRTPHETLPNPFDKPVYRQFFRLVVGPIDVWYTKHNTPNPLGILPPAQVEITDDDKFSQRGGDLQ
jgi:hypothetical protein